MSEHFTLNILIIQTKYQVNDSEWLLYVNNKKLMTQFLSAYYKLLSVLGEVKEIKR